MKKLLLILLTLFLLTSCGTITQGVVIKKWYEKATTQLVMMPIIQRVGQTTITTMLPYYIYDGEDWCIIIEGKTEKGVVKTKKLYLDKMEYARLKLGDIYILSMNFNYKDTSYKKERKR